MSTETGGASASVLHNAFAVLRCFSTTEPLLGVTEIANKVGLHKSTVSRILANLESQEIVAQDEHSRKYRLGTGLIFLVSPLLAEFDTRKVAAPILAELAAATEETCSLMAWENHEAVCVEQIESPLRIKHTSPLGARYNTGYSASIQVFLAAEPADRVRSLVERQEIVLPPGVQVEEYLALLAEVRERGYAVNDGMTQPDETGVAVSITSARSPHPFCLLLSAPRYRVTDQLAELVRACVAAGQQITTRLTGPTP
ncbi:IclR family transcriptional regulator [Micrococcoides hystricis]|uniref:IclR family transcriptional regulator n=1 Tax=Micrococcoides hystricis TaxID=1572761 RepID=A0ABV6P9T3_9MICC